MKGSPKMQILFALFITSLPNILLSQAENSQNNESLMSSQSLQVSFINETALYYHTLLSPKLDIKYGVSVFWNYDEKKDGEGYYQSLYSPSSMNEQKMKTNGINNNYEIILSSQLMYSLNEFEYAKAYLGIGPAFSYALTKYSNNNKNYTDTSYSMSGNDYNSSTLGIGPSLSLFIKSKLYGSVCLMLEYNLTTYYTWDTINYSYKSESKYSSSSAASLSYNKNHSESNGWKMRFSNVRVGLLIVL